MREENERLMASVRELSPLITDCLNRGQQVRLTVTGDSMAPFLRHRRDQVVLASAPAQLHVGDVPLYRRENGQYVLHRVVEADDGTVCHRLGQPDIPTKGTAQYTLLGDAQWKPEPGIVPEQIIAVAVGFDRLGKHWDCAGKKYRRRVLRWAKWLPFRPALMFLYWFPRKVIRWVHSMISP